MQKVYKDQFNADSQVIAYGAPSYKKQSKNSLERFNLSPQSYYLIVGRMIPDNNAHVLIHEFLASNSSKKLVVVGDVPYKDAYAQQLKSKASERLIFTGYVNEQEELLSLYQHCFIYLHGHEFGGTNPTMLKAMSNNCAILALDTVFNREMLGNGQFGLFFTKKPGVLAQEMERLEQHPDEIDQLRRIVAEGIGVMYDWDHVTDQYLSLFNKVLLK